MKAQFKQRPLSKKIRAESGSKTKRGNTAQVQQYFKKGKAEQLNNNYQRAIELYMLATTCNVSYFQAFCNMGYCYRALGRFNEAKQCYLNSLLINNQDPISHYNLANLYRVIGKNELAIDQYLDVISLKQNGVDIGNLYVNSLVNIGVCYKNKGEIEEAIKINYKVLEMDPNEESATFNLGICLLQAIEAKNRSYFNKYYHSRAEEAEELFKKVLETHPQNYMAQLSLWKISAIVNPQHENIQKIIICLKEMLTNSKCNIKDYINQEIARCLNLLKKYDESARLYEDSIGNITRRASMRKNQQTSPIQNIFDSFSQQDIKDPPNFAFISQADGITLIQSEQYELLLKKINELDDQNLLKQTLMLILYLRLAEYDENILNKAINVYDKYFSKFDEEGQFEILSFECHKAIGKVLGLQGNYQQSIKHYEYISQNIKENRNCASAQLHNDLGQGFQQVGNRKKAIQEYKKGIEIEPDNYSLTYSMGYCHYENGSYQQSAQCFKKIIERLNNDKNMNLETKELYLTDCMIIFALCHTESKEPFQYFTSAFKKLQRLKQSKQNTLEIQEQNLLIFFIKISQLYEQKLISLNIDSPDFKQTAEMLLSIYTNLLELNICPDKDEVLINCGNVNYLLHLYSTAADMYSHISNERLIPFVNLALCHAHILQPLLAMKYIQQACAMEPRSATNKFCKEILEWMYDSDHEGQWNRNLPNYKSDLFYERNEYGILILDKLTEIVNSSASYEQNQEKILQELVKNNLSNKSCISLINIKAEKMSFLSQKYNLIAPPSPKQILSHEVLKICFRKSEDIEKDINRLVKELYNMPKCGRQSQFVETALYLFVYNNQIDSQRINEIFIKITKRKIQQISMESSELKKQEYYSIYPDFKSIKQSISLFGQWETVLQRSIIQSVQILENIYYKGNIFQPFQREFQFPRHSNLLQNDQNFQKIYFIASNVFKYGKQLIYKGNNIREMKIDMVKQFQLSFNKFLKGSNLKPIHISNIFSPVTLYAFHQSKQDCIQFITQLRKDIKAEVSPILQDCDEIVIIVNKLVKVRCRWYNPYEIQSIVQESMEDIIQNPLYIVHQSIIYLQGMIKFLKNDSAEASRYLSLDSTLNF